MTEAIYLEVMGKTKAAHKAKSRVSVSGMLKYLSVSQSGYRAWLKYVPSNTNEQFWTYIPERSLPGLFQKHWKYLA